MQLLEKLIFMDFPHFLLFFFYSCINEVIKKKKTCVEIHIYIQFQVIGNQVSFDAIYEFKSNKGQQLMHYWSNSNKT